MKKTYDIEITAANDVRLNAREAGLGDGMVIVKPGQKLKGVSEGTTRELVTYGLAKTY